MSALSPTDIHRRDIHFDLSRVDLHYWHPDGFHVSHFFNVQSLLFPRGERFFIRSVRHFRDNIGDPALQRQVSGFIGQEAMHGREHEVYNEKLAAMGYRVNLMDRFLDMNFNFAERFLSPRTRLAMTVAFEHLTAIGAEDLLGDEQVLAGADAEMARLWRWHAMEETEHKAVAFDVYRQVVGTGPTAWLRRCLALLLTTLGMRLTIWVALLKVSFRFGYLFDLRGWGRLLRFLWLRPGVHRRQLPRFFRFFRPGFHPWDLDNSDQLRRWQGEYAKPGD